MYIYILLALQQIVHNKQSQYRKKHILDEKTNKQQVTWPLLQLLQSQQYYSNSNSNSNSNYNYCYYY